MQKILIAAAATLMSATLLTPPVSAAATADGDAVMAKISQLDQRISAAQEKGAISKIDAAKFGQRVDELEKLHARYALDGFTSIEVRALNQKLSTIKVQLAEAGDRA
jgi:hypothetical protein